MSIDSLKAKFFSYTLSAQLLVIMVTLIGTYGFIGPSLISSNSTIGVYIGIGIVGVTTYVLWVFSKNLRNKLKEGFTDENE